MAIVDMLMPRMGESVFEGNIIKWLKDVGDKIDEDESLLEVATDKVDTEIPSPYSGVVVEILAQEGDTVEVGKPIMRIETAQVEDIPSQDVTPVQETSTASVPDVEIKELVSPTVTTPSDLLLAEPVRGRFYSPLVMNISRKEGIEMPELERVKGTGKDGRVTKKDLFSYIEVRGQVKPIKEQVVVKEVSVPKVEKATPIEQQVFSKEPKPVSKPATSFSGETEIIEMTRMRKLIAERMLESKQTSAHVTSFVEADVTNVVFWRHKWKKHFKEKEDTILTLTPLFIEAVVKAIKDYPMINVSVDGDRIILKKDINISLAVALPSGNLITPVIKHADQLNIVGLTKQVNVVAKKARENKLGPDDLSDGTYTVSNMGSFGNVMGTPIINQPQVGILALGAVVKKPAVIETEYGDTIGIRHMMMLSHTYDHRVVDGALGGMFVRRVADYLEKFDPNRPI